MKSISKLLLLFVMFLLMGCPGAKGPEVSLKTSGIEGVPGTVISFDASESGVVGAEELRYCEFEILNEDGESVGGDISSFEDGEDKFARYSHEFKNPGKFTVTASISDFKQRVGKTSVEITIASFFSKLEDGLSLGFTKAYESTSLTFQPSGLDLANVASYSWKIVCNESEVVIIEGKVKNFTSAKGIAEPGTYTAYLTLFDKFGNSRTLNSTFEIVSSLNPAANFTVSNENSSLEEFYELQNVILDSSASVADNSGEAENTLTDYIWYLYKQTGPDRFDPALQPISKTTDEAFILQLPETGVYKLELEVKSSIGLSAVSEPYTFEVKEVKPTVESLALDFGAGDLYEGKPCSVTVTVDEFSTALTDGEISKIILDFENEDYTDFEYTVDGETTEFVFNWTPEFDAESTDTKIYSGSVYAVNAAGRVSDAFTIAPAPSVLSNVPVAVFQILSDTFFYGDSFTMYATESYSPVANDLLSLEIQLYDITDESNISLVKESGNVAFIPNRTLSYTFQSSGTGVLKYKAVCTISNSSGTVSVEKFLSVQEPYLMAAFSPKPDPDQVDVFAKTSVSLDASGSKNISGDLPSTFSWTVVKLLNGGGTEDFSSKVSGNASTGNYSISFPEPGSYKVTLTVEDGGVPSDPIEKIFNIKNNIPTDITISKSDDGAGNYTFTGSAVSPDSSGLIYRWYVDKDPASFGVLSDGAESSFEYIFLSGEHAVYLVVTNGGGDGESARKVLVFTAKDIEAPKAPLVTGDTPVAVFRPTWTWSPDSGEAVSKYRYYLAEDNDISTVSWIPTFDESTVSYTPDFDLGAGLHTLYVQARDEAGNWPADTDLTEDYTGRFEIEIDVTPPEAPEVTGAVATNDKTPTWSWNAPADAVGYRYQLDGEASDGWSSTVTGQSYTPVSDLISFGTQSFTLYVQACDEAGAWSDSGSCPITVDLDGPAMPTVTTVDPLINDRTPSWEFEGPVSDTITGYRFNVDGEDWVEITDLSALPGSVSVNGDGYIYTRPSGSQLSADAEDGDTHVFNLQALDAAGNWGATGSCAVTIDTTPLDPSVITITGVPFTKDRTPSWGFSGTTDVESLSYQFNTTTGDWISGSEYEIPAGVELSDGTYTLYVKALDKAGNWSAPASFDTTVDNVVPVINWASGHSDTVVLDYNSAAYTVAITDITVTDNGSQLTGGEYLSYEYTVYPAGHSAVDTTYPENYTIVYTATDAAGNSESVTKVVTVLPPPIDISGLTVVKPNYVEQNEDIVYTATGAVGNTVNDFGGDVVYKWTVSGAASHVDADPFVSINTETVNLNASNASVTLTLDIAYADFNDLVTTYNESYTVYPEISVPNGDFEASSSNIAPWKWDLDFRWKNSSIWRTDTTTVQDTSANYKWYYDLCSLAVDQGFNGSKCAKEFDTSFYPEGASADIAEYGGLLYSANISVTKDIPYKIVAKIKRNAVSANVKATFRAEGQGGLTFGGNGTVLTELPTGADLWHDVEVLFTPDDDGVFRVSFFRGDGWDKSQFVHGELLFDEVDLKYAE